MNTPIKWHGGKHYLADRITRLMPPRDGERPWHLYREPFAGGLSVLLRLVPEGLSETVNDIHFDLTNFWRVLTDEDWFEELYRRLAACPFSEIEFLSAQTTPGRLGHPVESAARVPVVAPTSAPAGGAGGRARARRYRGAVPEIHGVPHREATVRVRLLRAGGVPGDAEPEVHSVGRHRAIPGAAG